jgi:uncharacterized repeat protein (TIGR01451 family)
VLFAIHVPTWLWIPALFVALEWLAPVSAQAQYAQRYDTTAGGAVTFTGNSLGLDGQTNQNGQGTRGAIGTFITTDTALRDTNPVPVTAPEFPDGTTNDWRLNGSRAVLRLPEGARVLHAELLWGGTPAGNDAADNVVAFIDDPIVFTTPLGTFEVAPDPATARFAGQVAAGTCNGCFYMRSANVTAFVAAAKEGTYTVGRVPATQGTTDNSSPSAGWTLAVVYEDFAQPIRRLSLFLGLEPSGAMAALTGFCVASGGQGSARLAISAMEGDAASTGDQMLFGDNTNLNNGDRVDGPRNPPNNFFASQITNDAGALDTSGTFGSRNHTPGTPVAGSRQGWDITNVPAKLKGNQTTAIAQAITPAGDGFRLTALAMQIDVEAPSFPSAGSLSVDKTTAAVGDVLTYTAVINNSAGTTSADNTVFFDTLAAGTSFVADSFTINGAAQPGADPVTGVLLGTVAVGATITVTFQARVDAIPAGPNPQLRINRARWTFNYASCGGAPLFGSFETNSVVTTVPLADLGIIESFVGTAAAGTTVVYQIVVTNAGPNSVTSALVTDIGTTPALSNVTWTCQASAGGTCVAPSGTGPPSSSVSLDVSAIATFRVTGTLPASTPAGTLSGAASVAGATDANPANNTTAASIPIGKRADLEVTNTGPASALRGTEVTYTIAVTNRGPSDTANVLLTNPAPAGLTLVSLTGPCTASPGCVLGAGARLTATATFTIPPDYTGPDPIRNVASVTGPDFDPQSANNSAAATTALDANIADLSIAKTNGVDVVTIGAETAYTITVTNTGPASASGARVSDVLDPAVFADVRWQCVAGGTSTCAVTGPQTGNLDTLIDIDPGPANTVVFTVQARVRPDLATDVVSTVTNQATVTPPSGAGDPNTTNNSAADTDQTAAVADISIVKTGPPILSPGTSAEYQITVTNSGPSASPPLEVLLVATRLDTGQVVGASIQGITGPGVTCRSFNIAPGGQPEVFVPLCLTPALGPGQSVTLIEPVVVPADLGVRLGFNTPVTVRNIARIVTTAPGDPDTADTESALDIAITPLADVLITLDGPAAIVAGAAGSYFITVSNGGPSTATNVVITSPLPAGLSLAGGSGPCASGFPCTIPLLAPGETSTTRIDLLVPADYVSPPTFVNTATVGSVVADPAGTNNSASVSTLVVQEQADLAVTITGPASIAPGNVGQLVARVTNLGPGPASAVTSSVVLPGGVALLHAIVPGPPTTCSVPSLGTGNLASCVTPQLPVGGVLEYVIQLQAPSAVLPGTRTSLVGAASSPTPDFQSSNDRGELQVVVAAPDEADVVVETTDSADPVVAGSDVTYSILVRNTGPAAATKVVVTDQLPAGFALVSAAASQGSCAAATCTLGTLAADGSATVTVVATPPATGVFLNTATVTAVESDPAPANNAATELTTVAAADGADLLVEKRGPTLLAPGESSLYSIKVTNRGPAAALSVQILDPLPPGVTFVGNSKDCEVAFPCEFDTIAAGESFMISTAFTVAPDLVTPAALVNTVTVDSPVAPGPNQANNTSTVTTTVQPADSADLVVLLRAANIIATGTTFSYALTLANRGPAAASDIVLTTTLPAGVSVIAADSTLGTCTGSPTVTCAIGTMPPGSLIEVGILATSPSALPTPNPMIATASVTASGLVDFDLTNNTASAATTVVLPTADLGITNVLTTSAIPGLAAGYTIVVSNNGPSTITGATVSDVFPAALIGPTWTCTATSGAACGAASGIGPIATTVNLGPAGTATFTVSGTLASSAVGLLVNTATVAAPGTTDPNSANDSATSSVPLTPSADLRIAKSGLAQATPGGSISYAITITNAGPSDAVEVTLADPAPVGLTFVSGGGACAAYPCSLVTVAAGTTIAASVVFAVPSGYTTPDPIVNTATVTSTTPDPATGNNTATATTAIAAPVTDLSITKTNGAPFVVPGTTTTYTIAVTNAGPSNANGASISDIFPAALTSVTWTCAGSGGASCRTPTGTGNIVTLADIPVGGVVIVTATGTIALDAVGVLVNTASVMPGPGASDPTSANNTDSDTVVPQVDLTIAKTGPVSAVAGGTVVYDITVSNNGPSNAEQVVVNDPTPDGLAFVSNSGACTTPFPCQLGTLAPGASRTITATFRVPSIGPVPATIVNSASVTTTTTDLDPANNTATFETRFDRTADVELSATISPAGARIGDTVTLRITAVNQGPNVATGVQVTDRLPSGLGFVSSVVSQGAYNATTGGWDVGDLAVGTSATLDLTATIRSPGSIANLAIKTAQTEIDPDTTNDSSSVTSDAAPAADLAVSMRVDRGAPAVGQNVTFTVRVINRGPNATNGASVTDLLAPGLTFVSASPSQGTYDAATGLWTVGALAPLAEAMLTMVAQVSQAGALVNNAVVAGQSLTDPNPVNDSSAAVVNGVGTSDLLVAKAVSNLAPAVGTTVTYTIAVANLGPEATASAGIVDQLPAGLTFVSATASSGTYDAGTGLWTTGSLAAGQSAVLSIDARADVSGVFINTATRQSSTPPDPNSVNDTSSVTATASVVADLAITKVPGTSVALPGAALSWTITVTNDGPSAAAAVAVVDTFPALFTGVTWSCAASTDSACASALGTGSIATTVDLAAGGTATFVAAGTVSSAATGSLDNLASVAVPSGTTDPVAANNTATSSVPVVAATDLAIVVTGPASVIPGSTITYTLTVTNAGPSAALDVVVQDPTPPGLTFVSNAGDCVTAFPCALGTLLVGESRTITATFGVPADYVAPTPIVNTVTVVATTIDPVPADNIATASTSVQLEGDVEVTKSAPLRAAVGDIVTMTIRALNHSPRAVTGVAITDLLPAGLAFVSAIPTQGTYDSGSGLWTVGSLATDATAELAIAAAVTEPGPVTNLALKTGGNEPDSNTANDSAAAAINAAATADLAVLTVVDRAQALAGETVTFTVTVINRGSGPATGVSITDALPNGFTLTTATPSQGVYDSAGGVWTVGTIALNAASKLTLTGTLTTGGLVVNNAAIRTQAEIDPNPLNNSSAASVNAAAMSDLRVTKAVSNPSPLPGASVTFTIAVTNLGPAAATTTTLRDLLPVGLTFGSATASQGSYDVTTGDWSIGAIALSQTATLAVTARVDRPGTISNVATRIDSAPSDPNPINDSASIVLTALQLADLAVTVSPAAASVTPGAALAWTVVATNAGPSAVSGATVISTFSSVATVAWTCTATAGSTCAAAGGAGLLSTSLTLAAGGSATFNVEGLVAASATGALTNTTSITAPAGVIDPAPANNVASSSVVVIEPPPPPPPPPTPPPPSSRACWPGGTGELRSGQVLFPGESVFSTSGRFMFVYQYDRNIVLYDDRLPVWSSGTIGSSPGVLRMQLDGNLVLYDANDIPIWDSGTVGHPGASLAVQNDGNAVIYDRGSPLWSTDTVATTPSEGCPPDSLVLFPGSALSSPSGRFFLLYQLDGNLVLYDRGIEPLWASGTLGVPTGQVIMQGDGNLVLYDRAGRPAFATNTSGNPGAQLRLQDDGNLVIYTSHGVPIWATMTFR